MRYSSNSHDLYVITVNYKSWDYIGRLVTSLSNLDAVSELVIVDHSPSTEPVSPFQADFPVTVITQPNKGYGAGLNRGLRHISRPGSMALVCNPDTEVLDHSELLAAVEYLARNQMVACVIPGMQRPDGERIHAGRKFHTLKTLIGCRIESMIAARGTFFGDHYYAGTDGKSPREVDWGSGSALLLRCDLFPEVIAFDERFFLYFEDVDICAQIWRKGFSVISWPRVIFSHVEQRRSRTSLKHFAWLLASALKFMFKYRGLPNRDDLLGGTPPVIALSEDSSEVAQPQAARGNQRTAGMWG